MKRLDMIKEIRDRLYTVHVIYGMYGVGCRIETVTGDVKAEVRGEDHEEDAVRAAYLKWKSDGWARV